MLLNTMYIFRPPTPIVWACTRELRSTVAAGESGAIKMSMNEDVFYVIGLGFLVVSLLMLFTFPKESASKKSKKL